MVKLVFFLNLAKGGLFENSENQLFCSKIINFWNFREKISEKTHFIILRIISWLLGAYAEGVIWEFLNKRINDKIFSLNGLVLLLDSSIFEISSEEHFWMNYSFRNLTWKVKNKMYIRLLLTWSENL